MEERYTNLWLVVDFGSRQFPSTSLDVDDRLAKMVLAAVLAFTK